MPPVTFTIDEAVVLLGLLHLVEVPADVHPLATRVTARVEHRLRSALDRNHSCGRGHLPPEEAEALRLTRLLQASLDDVAAIVNLLEELTQPHHRPSHMLALSELSARSLTGRLQGLAS